MRDNGTPPPPVPPGAGALPPPVRPQAVARSPGEVALPTRPPKPPKRLKERGEPRRMGGVLRFANGLLSFTFLALVIAGVLAMSLRASFDAQGPLDTATVVAIAKGESTYDTAGRLEKDGVISDRRLFMAQYYAQRLYGGLSGERAAIRAGDYEIKKGASLRQVLDTLVEGRAILLKVTVPEGLTSQQIVERLKADPNLQGEISAVPAEGTLLPDTYKFSRGMTRQEIVDRMQAEHLKLLAAVWAKRQPDLPVKTPEQAMVLASIIEKETGKSDEREKVAAVFVNRLKVKMRMQSDPTIIYGLVGGQGPLGRAITRADIDSRTPYNTYQIDGLPPGPICNPGRAAIEATLNPAKTSDLYFVADGTGGHTFTTNLRDHNSAVQRWRQVERERAAKQQQGAPAAPAAPGVLPAPTPVQVQTIPVAPAAPVQAGTQPAKKSNKQ